MVVRSWCEGEGHVHACLLSPWKQMKGVTAEHPGVLYVVLQANTRSRKEQGWAMPLKPGAVESGWKVVRIKKHLVKHLNGRLLCLCCPKRYKFGFSPSLSWHSQAPFLRGGLLLTAVSPRIPHRPEKSGVCFVERGTQVNLTSRDVCRQQLKLKLCCVYCGLEER